MATRDVLSNEEVDAIMDTVADKTDSGSSEELNQANTQEEAEAELKVHRAFDFTSREHFALAQMKGLSVANEKFCMELQLELNQSFGVPMEVSLSKLEILKIDECMTSLRDDAVLNIMKVNLADGKGLLVINGDLISELINRYFGSQMAQSTGSKSGRSLNATQSRINERLIQLFCQSLKLGWKDIAALDLEKTMTETNPEFINLGEKDELGVRFTLDIDFGDFAGSIQWLLPYTSIEPLSSRAENSSSVSDTQKAAAWGAQLYDNIQEVSLDIQVVMTDFEMSLREVNQLQVGSVIALGNPGDVRLYIEGIPVFTGECGAHQDQKAVSLKHRIELTGG